MNVNPAKATSAYAQELKINPGSPVALYNLGKIDVEHGRPAEGITLLRQAVQVHAQPGPTAFYLGYGLAQTGENAEAARWLETALASDASSFIQESALFQLARVYQRLGRKQDAERAERIGQVASDFVWLEWHAALLSRLAVAHFYLHRTHV